MKISELIEELQRLPKDLDVVMQYGPDDDDTALVFGLSTGWYDEWDRQFTPLILEIDIPDERLYRERTINECNAACLCI